MKNKTKAIILAAGEGKRLRPYTSDRPKCMVEYNSKPLLVSQISTLKNAGVDEVVVVTGYLSEVIESIGGFRTIKNEIYDKSNMVYSLFCAEDELDEQADILICYSDILYNEEIIKKVIESEADFSTSIDMNWKFLWELRNEDVLSDAETLKLDRDGNIVEIGKKPKRESEIEAQYMGITKVKSSFVKTLKNFYYGLDSSVLYDGKDKNNMYMTSFLQGLVNSGYPLAGVKVSGGWFEVDTVEDLHLYRDLFEKGKISSDYIFS